jgi:glycosyltransferase domain-containing protein
MFQPQADFTLLIPTFNRPAMFAQLAHYLARHRTSFAIVVADASRIEDQVENAKTLASLPLAATHRRFTPGALFAETVVRSVAEIETRYCSIIADDDVILPRGLAASLAWLREHPDFAAAQGYHIGFLPHQDGLWLIDVPEWIPNIDEDSPLARLAHYGRRYQPVAFAAYQTEVLLRSFRAVLNVRNPLFMEKTQAFLAVFEGKLARIPVFYRLRREEGSVVSRQRVHIFHQFLASPEKLLSDLLEHRGKLVEAYAAGPDAALGRDGVARVIDLIHGHYFNRHFDGGTTSFEIEKALGLTDKIASSPRAPLPPGENRAMTITDTDGEKRRFWIGDGIDEAWRNPEIHVGERELREAIYDAAAYR